MHQLCCLVVDVFVQIAFILLILPAGAALAFSESARLGSHTEPKRRPTRPFKGMTECWNASDLLAPR
jgi:hypothetical protein